MYTFVEYFIQKRLELHGITLLSIWGIGKMMASKLSFVLKKGTFVIQHSTFI